MRTSLSQHRCESNSPRESRAYFQDAPGSTETTVVVTDLNGTDSFPTVATPMRKGASIETSRESSPEQRPPSLADRGKKLLYLRDLETARLLPANAELDERLSRTDFGGVHCDRRSPIFERYPVGVQVPLKQFYLETAGPTCVVLFGEHRWRAIDEGRGTDSYYQADIELAAKDVALRASFAHLAFDDCELQHRASSHARACYRISSGGPLERALRVACDYTRRQGIVPPKPGKRGLTPTGCVNRLSADRWWRRALRRTYLRKAEESLRAEGFVHRGESLYVSAAALQAVIDRDVRNLHLLEKALATNDLGQSFSLAELSGRNTSNPVIRRAELMVRARGCEDYAKQNGHVARFFVVTLPSRFHCRDEHGRRVLKFDGSTPKDGQRWLNTQWQRVRASLHRKCIACYGLRTAEPHHDGTPHWNVLVFAAPADMGAIASAIEEHFLLSDSPDELGARARRIRCIEIDPTKGATAYITKYISKGIDGFRVGVDHEDTDRQRDAAETCVRVEAWARIHGIRQFQFFGGPAVSIWRELRRLGRPSLGVIEEARQAADVADWCGFLRAMGGVQPCSGARPIRLHKVYEGAVGMYGDRLGPTVVGIESDELVEVTRIREWRVNWHSERSDGGVSGNSFLPWSSVNNCTRVGAKTKRTPDCGST